MNFLYAAYTATWIIHIAYLGICRRGFDPHHACREANAHRLSLGDVGRKCHGDFDAHALGQRTIKKEEYAACAYILGLGREIAKALPSYPNRRGQMHIKPPHSASFLPGLLYRTFSLQTHESRPSQNSPRMAGQHPLKESY